MHARSSTQKYIAQAYEKVSRWCTWAEAKERQTTPLLQESLPSGY